MIAVKGVTKKFFHVIALDNISLRIPEKSISAVIGPNGAGKTILLKTICGLVIPDSGCVSCEGSFTYLSSDHDAFYPQLTAYQNFEFFSAMFNIDKKIMRERLSLYAPLLGLTQLDKPFWQYSTGYKRRLSLLRISMLSSDNIILDEPTKSLDEESKETLFSHLEQLRDVHGKTIIFSDHNKERAKKIADNIFCLNKGRVVDV